MLLYFLVIYLFVFILYFVFEGRKFSSKFSLLFGVFSTALAVLIANSVNINTYYIFIIAFLFALNIVFFWTIYNTLHFKYSLKEEHGFKSGAYFLLVPILAAILSPISGLVVEKLGFHFLFSSSMLLFLVPFILAFYLPNFKFEFETKEALFTTEHSLLVIFQGYIFMLTSNVVPIFTLFFISTPLKLGSFFGYLAIFAALASLFNSKISDKLKKRAPFFYTFIIFNALSYIPLVFSKSLLNWQIFSGINNFTYGLTNPFDFTLVLDHAKNDVGKTMLGRELYLNFGRVAMVVFILILYYLTSSLWSALIYSALVPLFYPIVAYYQRVYLK